MFEELGFIDGIIEMAICSSCGKKLGFLEVGSEGRCTQCAYLENMPQQYKDEVAEKVVRSAKIEAIMLTTETAPNLNITKRIEIVTAECAFGMNMFKDLFAGVRDIVGGRSKAVQDTMRDSRKTVVSRKWWKFSGGVLRAF